MRRIMLVTVALALIAAALAAWGGASPSTPSGSAAHAQAKKPKLPPLPANIRQRGRWIIGVKCDVPPFGYINVKGQNAGFDVEIARWFARYAFGKASRVTFTCAPTPSREPLLLTDRVDLVISTYTYTAARDQLIDFSRAYYKAGGRLLVKNDTTINTLGDLAGKTVSTTTGSIYDKWVGNCFKQTKVNAFDSFANAVIAFRDGRADAVMWDDTALLGIAVSDGTVKLAPPSFLTAPYGIGIRQGRVSLKRWVDSRLNLMKQKDTFATILRNNVPARVYTAFQDNILRPRNNFGYNAVDPTTVCP
jgi:polar amino acid transport system substrate-binding protein